MLQGVVLLARVGGRLVVVRAVGVRAMIAPEWKKVNHIALCGVTLLANE